MEKVANEVPQNPQPGQQDVANMLLWEDPSPPSACDMVCNFPSPLGFPLK